eukprot:CAMPEP_0176145204 /NCGR_PEP_ID=MMETSP0120_2-20121206/73953_1 /TAXON_ID=160619 /ORGANISM="Kryptoperidinium foliaceum, Strain CCMP 1326" /LENGTH=195 /DNA_ID=CAMNT_0017481639 /DNA_START=343 /DNA_END=931 /DNA_ORIENTATION=-
MLTQKRHVELLREAEDVLVCIVGADVIIAAEAVDEVKQRPDGLGVSNAMQVQLRVAARRLLRRLRVRGRRRPLTGGASRAACGHSARCGVGLVVAEVCQHLAHGAAQRSERHLVRGEPVFPASKEDIVQLAFLVQAAEAVGQRSADGFHLWRLELHMGGTGFCSDCGAAGAARAAAEPHNMLRNPLRSCVLAPAA